MVEAMVIGLEEQRRMPWKNGGGITTEIAIAPVAAAVDDFDWRLSVAEVARSGPFSPFPGCQRTIALLDGAGMTLEFADGRRHELAPMQPWTFDGAAAVEGTLAHGPVRDLNLICARHRASGSMRALASPGEQGVVLELNAPIAFVVCVAGALDIDLRAERRGWSLLRGEVLRLDGGCRPPSVLVREADEDAAAMLVEVKLSMA